jgi:phage tail-like protein
VSGSRLPRYWLAEQLPRPLADDPFLRSLSLIFEDLADSVREPVLNFEHFLDPDLAPPEFVRWMAQWLGLEIDASLPESRQRSALRSAGILLPWRGTKRGLQGLLESLVGSTVEVVEHGGVFRDGHSPGYDPRVTVRVEHPGGMDESQLRRLIETELPADAELELLIGRSKVGQGSGGPVSQERGTLDGA